MSGSDPSGFGWFSDLIHADDSQPGLAILGFGVGAVGGAYLSTLTSGNSLEGFTGSSGFGGGLAIGQAVYEAGYGSTGETYAKPKGELGSGAQQATGNGLYNESAGAPPAGADNRLAVIPCHASPEECTQRILDLQLGTGVGGVSIAVEGAEAAAGWVARAVRWILARFWRTGADGCIRPTDHR